MPIQIIIDGITKTVVQPEVNIDGTWREVNVVSHNINGAWRESFNRNIYKIKLYRYGVLYDTLSVQKGSSVTLPSVATVQNDDIAHYGWATNPTATARNYSATQTITPTNDMDLYAVYSYSKIVNVTGTITSGGSTSTVAVDATVPVAGTIIIKGYSYDVYVGPNLTSAPTPTYGGFSLQTDGTAPYVKINNQYYSGHLSAYNPSQFTSTIQFDVDANTTISILGIHTSTAESDGGSVTHSNTIIVEYPTNQTTTQTAYRTSL